MRTLIPKNVNFRHTKCITFNNRIAFKSEWQNPDIHSRPLTAHTKEHIDVRNICRDMVEQVIKYAHPIWQPSKYTYRYQLTVNEFFF